MTGVKPDSGMYSTIRNEIDGKLGSRSISELMPPARDHFTYQIYASEVLLGEGLETLELTNRSLNSLHRAGYKTIGDMLQVVRSSEDLRQIRNCGKTSSDEIMEKLFLYHYSLMEEGSRGKYLKTTLELNGIVY